ncbi:MAG: DNA cytosine methyltransferase [Rhizomicrobium sp.]
MRTYYNEIDQFAAAWLLELMKKGLISGGEIDTRSIIDVRPGDLRGFTRCHFFAGIGGWDYALKLAGWPEEWPVWTGSCPCQPLSSAGQRKGHADERHLWPAFYRLISECAPSSVFGEQVASKDGREWLAGVRADMEALGYAFGAADLCAAGVGASHIRQRLFWVADAARDGREQRRPEPSGRGAPGGCVKGSGMGNTDNAGSQGRREHAGEYADQRTAWAPSVLIPCADGKHRRVPANEAGEPESEIFPLAHGVPNRVGTLRGAGNAIVPQVAAQFIAAYMESKE